MQSYDILYTIIYYFMIREIKHNRILNDFKNKFYTDSYLIDKPRYNYFQWIHKKSECKLLVKDERIFSINIRYIIELIPTELERDDIIDLLNSEFNKNNLPYHVN